VEAASKFAFRPLLFLIILLFCSPYKPNPDYKGKWYAPMIDNPAYKGVWAPRKIPNPDYFEDLTPVNSLNKIVRPSFSSNFFWAYPDEKGGVGIELWTMTEDILFDNIYVGHSIDDAKAFAAETFDIKHPLEKATEKAALPDDDQDVDELTFAENPVEFLRNKAFMFIALARLDPVTAFKTHPETGVALVGALLTFFGMLGALFGLVGSQQKSVTKV
jgi:116 kDa U5 small nuclear ribonucleoprotein component